MGAPSRELEAVQRELEYFERKYAQVSRALNRLTSCASAGSQQSAGSQTSGAQARDELAAPGQQLAGAARSALAGRLHSPSSAASSNSSRASSSASNSPPPPPLQGQNLQPTTLGLASLSPKNHPLPVQQASETQSEGEQEPELALPHGGRSASSAASLATGGCNGALAQPRQPSSKQQQQLQHAHQSSAGRSSSWSLRGSTSPPQAPSVAAAAGESGTPTRRLLPREPSQAAPQVRHLSVAAGACAPEALLQAAHLRRTSESVQLLGQSRLHKLQAHQQQQQQQGLLNPHLQLADGDQVLAFAPTSGQHRLSVCSTPGASAAELLLAGQQQLASARGDLVQLRQQQQQQVVTVACAPIARSLQSVDCVEQTRQLLGDTYYQRRQHRLSVDLLASVSGQSESENELELELELEPELEEEEAAGGEVEEVEAEEEAAGADFRLMRRRQPMDGSVLEPRSMSGGASVAQASLEPNTSHLQASANKQHQLRLLPDFGAPGQARGPSLTNTAQLHSISATNLSHWPGQPTGRPSMGSIERRESSAAASASSPEAPPAHSFHAQLHSGRHLFGRPAGAQLAGSRLAAQALSHSSTGGRGSDGGAY